jgi:hypothetical protein
MRTLICLGVVARVAVALTAADAKDDAKAAAKKLAEKANYSWTSA